MENTGKNDYTLNVIIDDELLLINSICQNFPFGGTGDGVGNPYQVSHICQLQNIAADDITIDGIAYTDLLNKNYILTENIEANYTAEWNNGAGFVPLGDEDTAFNGTFDGDGFIIRNLTIDLSTSNNIGLFGVNSGTITDVTLDSAAVIGNENVGGLVGLNSGTIDNVSVKNVDITGSDTIGGFVGFDDNGTYSGNSYCQQNNSQLPLPAVGNGSIAGIITYNENCEVTSISTASELQDINIFLSRAYKLVNTIDVSTINNFIPLGNADTTFDGIFDGGGFTIRNLTIDVSDSNNIGLFGNNSGTITDFTLENAAVIGNENVGGLVGLNSGTIENVAVENVTITGNTNIGGFVGNDNGGTYSEDRYCQLNSELPAVGNGSILEITTYDANCEIVLISTASELQAINNNLIRAYRLAKDIDLSSGNFTPLGDGSNSFDGTFDGGGFTISNLTIDLSASNNIGLFGSNSGIIKDFTLENVGITGNENVGGLVGVNDGTIDNVTSFGMVVGNTDVGGFIGNNSGTIKNSTSFASVGDSGTNVGGFIGRDDSGSYTNNKWCNPANGSVLEAVGNGGDGNGNIEGIDVYMCIITATDLQAINSDSSSLNGSYILINDIDVVASISEFTPIGGDTRIFKGMFEGSGFTISNLIVANGGNFSGLFGYNEGTITNVTLEDVSIDAGNGSSVGGLVGRNNNSGTIENSSSSGSVEGANNIGGLVGQNQGTITNSSASGSVEGDSHVGGLVGRNTSSGTIDNSSASGNVTGSTINVGGFVGQNQGTITNSSASGNVTSSSGGAGGFVGQ